MYNFTEISELLIDAGGMLQLGDAGDLTASVLSLLLDAQRQALMGAAGQAVVAANRGARERLLVLIDEQLTSA